MARARIAPNNTAAGRGVSVLPGRASASAPSYTEGAVAYLSFDLNGNLRITSSGSGVSQQDNTAFTGGASFVGPMGALYDTTPPAIADGNIGAPRMSSSRILYVEVTGTATTTTTAGSPSVASVGVASALAVAANANRKSLTVENVSTSGQRISLGIGVAAVLDSGITLWPGDSATMSPNGQNLSVAAVNAISSAASGSLSYQEYT